MRSERLPELQLLAHSSRLQKLTSTLVEVWRRLGKVQIDLAFLSACTNFLYRIPEHFVDYATKK